jgi:hypothetical protein
VIEESMGDGEPLRTEPAPSLVISLAGSLEACTVVDGSYTARLDSPTFSRQIELRYDPTTTDLVTSLLCCVVVVQGRLLFEPDKGVWVIEVVKIRSLEPATASQLTGGVN